VEVGDKGAKMARKISFTIRLGKRDLAQLQVISQVYELSLAAAIRAAIRAMAEQLGVPRQDHISEK
jgi:hypothetical protein